MDGSPEIEKTYQISHKEAKNLQNLIFNFQGSQEMHIRVIISPNGLDQFFKNSYFLHP